MSLKKVRSTNKTYVFGMSHLYMYPIPGTPRSGRS